MTYVMAEIKYHKLLNRVHHDVWKVIANFEYFKKAVDYITRATVVPDIEGAIDNMVIDENAIDNSSYNNLMKIRRMK